MKGGENVGIEKKKQKQKPIHAIKFRNYCKDNGVTAKQLALLLHLNTKTIYAMWAGEIQVSDHYKKVLEKELKMPIYDIFLNDSFDVEAIVTFRNRGA